MQTKDYAEIWRILWRLDGRLCEYAREDSASTRRQAGKASLAQIRVLGVLYEQRDKGLRMSEMAEALRLTPGAVTQSVDFLVREKMVERHADPSDRRVITVSLSELGRTLLSEANHRIEQALIRAMSGIPLQEQRIFSNVLQQIYKNLSEPPEVPQVN